MWHLSRGAWNNFHFKSCSSTSAACLEKFFLLHLSLDTLAELLNSTDIWIDLSGLLEYLSIWQQLANIFYNKCCHMAKQQRETERLAKRMQGSPPHPFPPKKMPYMKPIYNDVQHLTFLTLKSQKSSSWNMSFPKVTLFLTSRWITEWSSPLQTDKTMHDGSHRRNILLTNDAFVLSNEPHGGPKTACVCAHLFTTSPSLLVPTG